VGKPRSIETLPFTDQEAPSVPAIDGVTLRARLVFHESKRHASIAPFGFSVGRRATEPIEMETCVVEGEFAADESMAPVWIDGELMAQQGDHAVFARATHEDHECVRRNVCQDVGRAGTGESPWALRMRAIVDRPTTGRHA
jgi:hypothetical protein